MKRDHRGYRLVAGVFLASLLCALLCACGSQAAKGKSESEIAQDIQRNDPYFDRCQLTLDSFSEIKRQTNLEDKTDYVWFEVNGSNQAFTYYGTYELTYVLYNDGWQLEEFEQTWTNITPVSYPTEEMAKDATEGFYPGCEFLSYEYDYERNTAQFLFEWAETAYYVTTVYDITLDYTFSVDKGWTGTYGRQERATYPEIVGEWRYEEHNDGDVDRNYVKSRSYYIKVLSCAGGTVRFEYDLSIVEHDKGNMFKDPHDVEAHQRSSGPVEATLVNVLSKNREYEYYVSYSIPAFPTIWVYLGPGTVNHRGAGLFVDGCLLTKVS